MNSDTENETGPSKKHFRFFDNRQKYLMFVHTCSEKDVIAKRVGQELDQIAPTPPALRVFDGGIGDGTVLSKVMREMHGRFPTTPFYISGKEISLEDIRLSLEKMADRLFEHPATVIVFTNMFYAEAPWLTPRSAAKADMVWKEVALQGTTSHEFDQQITDLHDFLGENWQAKHSEKTGNPIYEKPVALVLYREDHKFLLHDVIPKKGEAKADFDLVLASQPYRLRVAVEQKVRNVVAPLVRALRSGGRLLGIHSCGQDPGMELIQKVWPDDNPFTSTRNDIFEATQSILGDEASDYEYHDTSDEEAIFRYQMHTLPVEVDANIGTSTLYAAWNAAIYVAQISDDRLDPELLGSLYLEATKDVLKSNDGLWFNDEAYVISKK